MPLLALVRHGQSLWNKENRFTGWVDVPLTLEGQAEARRAGERLKDHEFQVAYTSDLRRAQDTLTLMLETMGVDLPVIRNAALNERDYGDLAGLNKQEMREKFSPEIVHVWRRSFDIPPPGGESLKECSERTLPFFERAVLGDIKQGKNVLVSAHGNSNRAIVMKLESLTPEQILQTELATGIPRLYEMTESGEVKGVTVLE